MRIVDEKLAVFDLETTGVDIAESRVVEFGAAVYEDGRWSRRRTRVNPGIPIPKEASDVHGIDDAAVADCQTFTDVWPRVLGLLSGRRLVGYNVLRYDLPLLDAEVQRHGCGQSLTSQGVIDVMVFVNWRLRGAGSRKLTEVAGRFGIRAEGGEAHNAAVDCQMTGRLLLAMVDKGLIPEHVDDALAEQERAFPIIESEYSRYGTFLYRDRDNNRLRIGAGKYIGELLADVPKSYLQFIVSRFTDLTPDTQAAMRAAADGSLREEMQERLPGVSLADVVVVDKRGGDGDIRR